MYNGKFVSEKFSAWSDLMGDEQRLMLVYIRASIVFVCLPLLCLPIQASVWKSADEFGLVSYSNFRPVGQADVILGSNSDRVLSDWDRYYTNCHRVCNRQASNWWRKSKKYLALEKYLADAAKESGIDQSLLEAIAATESAFEEGAVSRKGAVGVMQIMPSTARQYGVVGLHRRDIESQLKVPSINIRVAARHLAHLKNKYPRRLDLVLAAYNAGEGAVALASNRVPAFDETRKYVSSVMYLYAMARG